MTRLCAALTTIAAGAFGATALVIADAIVRAASTQGPF